MLANELSQQGLPKQPLCSPLLHSHRLQSLKGAVRARKAGPPATTPVKGLTDTALLPYQRALVFASWQVLTQLFAKAIISIFLFSFFFF